MTERRYDGRSRALRSGDGALGMDTSQRTLDRMEAERPNTMSFGEQVVEALGEYVDAKLDFAETRRGPAAEYANPDPVDKAATRLQGLLDKVKLAR